jgi:hypothetical protein
MFSTKRWILIVGTLALAAPVIAADMSAVWELHADFDERSIAGAWSDCTFRQNGARLTGKCDDATLTGQISGEVVSWSLSPAGTHDTITFTGMVDDDRTVMTGRFMYVSKGGGSFLAVRHSSSIASQSVMEKEQFDVEKAHVYESRVQPHSPVLAPRGHTTNRVFIYMDDGVMTRRVGQSATSTIVFHRGDVGWVPASGSYVSENTTDHPVRILMVDLKSKSSGPTSLTKLDPVIVDPKHYTVVLENDQVRVLRIHFEPHDKGPQHEHLLDRVVLYLNDQERGKADDVRMAGAGTHTEENTSERSADRIAIELK